MFSPQSTSQKTPARINKRISIQNETSTTVLLKLQSFRELAYLQFLEIAALARSIERPSKVAKFATSFGPLTSHTEGAALENTRFFPRVQSTNN